MKSEFDQLIPFEADNIVPDFWRRRAEWLSDCERKLEYQDEW
jgi:hypothetical protein